MNQTAKKRETNNKNPTKQTAPNKNPSHGRRSTYAGVLIRSYLYDRRRTACFPYSVGSSVKRSGMGTRRSGRRASKLDKEDRGCMDWLVAVTYLATTTTRAKASFRSPGAALPCDETTRAKASFWPSGRRLLDFFRVSGRRDDPRRCSGELGEVGAGGMRRQRARRASGQGPFICLDEKIMTRALHAAGPLEYCVAI